VRRYNCTLRVNRCTSCHSAWPRGNINFFLSEVGLLVQLSMLIRETLCVCLVAWLLQTQLRRLLMAVPGSQESLKIQLYASRLPPSCEPTESDKSVFRECNCKIFCSGTAVYRASRPGRGKILLVSTGSRPVPGPIQSPGALPRG
jgi:hypothetical protein